VTQIADDVLTLGGNAPDYIRGRGRDGPVEQISGESSNQYGLQWDIHDITGTECFRESVTKELVQESTSVEETTQTSTLQTTRLGSQITNPVVSPSQNTAEYNRALGGDESGIQVSGESSGRFAGHIIWVITDVTEREGVRESTFTQELAGSSSQTMQTSSELATAQQMTNPKD
jgi:hypothetical protein